MLMPEIFKANYHIGTSGCQEDSLMALTTDISLSLILVTTDRNDLQNQKDLGFFHHLDLDGMYQMKNLWNLFQIPLLS